ncbi:MAG: hypothetical protein IPN58_13665 [Anaerolineales bacterium]|nr:hypothetical protein [Anaerolineales bacterium]
MSSKEQKPAINPVVIVVLGVAFIAIALILFVFPNGQSLNPQAQAHGANLLSLSLQASPLAD